MISGDRVPKVGFGFCVPILAGAGASYDSPDFPFLKMAVEECEELGFDSLWVADHLILGWRGAILECWTTLSALASVTKKMRIGTLVLCPSHRHPALVAKMAATLDLISGGRLDLGYGAGWHKSEQEAYGLEWYESPKVRIQRMEEAIEIARLMWTQEKPSYRGRYYRIEEAVCEPKPLQKPHPPIWIGGGGEKLLLRAVAKYADGWNVTPIPVDVYAKKLDALEKHCIDLGRDFGAIKKSLETRIIIAEDDAKALHTARKGGYFIGKTSMEELRRIFIIGDPGVCIRRIEEYVKLGVSHIMLWFLDLPSMDGLRLFAKEVMPSFQ
ncbi:MAG: TIGR03560 family F420-dependent LLM class oxidoreductase [Candidatus Bathyarchaeia archaeon]